MKLLRIENGCWDDKVNFVDENNIVLGYDMDQSCCEHAGYTLLDDEPTSYIDEETNKSVEEINTEIEHFVFDKSFFKKIEDKGSYSDGNENAVFKIVRGEESKFILLFNSHNGYYSHGFSFDDGDNNIQSDSI